MNGIWSLCYESHQIGIDVLIKHGAIAQNTTLRVNVLDGILAGNANNMLFRIVPSKAHIPNRRTR